MVINVAIIINASVKLSVKQQIEVDAESVCLWDELSTECVLSSTEHQQKGYCAYSSLSSPLPANEWYMKWDKWVVFEGLPTAEGCYVVSGFGHANSMVEIYLQ